FFILAAAGMVFAGEGPSGAPAENVAASAVRNISLEAAIGRALTENLDIQIARHGLAKAEADYRRTRSEVFYPALSVMLQWAPDNRGTQVFGSTFVRTSSSSLTSSSTLSQNFGGGSTFGLTYSENRIANASTLGGNTAATAYINETDVFYSLKLFPDDRRQFHLGMDLTKIGVEQARVTARDKASEVSLNVASAYWNVARTEDILNAREAALKEAQETYDSVKANYDAGRLSIVEFGTAEANLAARQVDEEAARQDLKSARDTFLLLLDLPYDEEFEVEPLAEFPHTEADAEATIQEILDRAPALRLVDLERKSAELDLHNARATGEGDLSFDISAGFQGSGADHASASESMKYSGLNIELRYTTVFGLTDREVAPVMFNLESLKRQRDLTEMQLTQQGRKALRDIESGFARAAAAKKGLEASQKSLEGVRARYDVGMVTLLEVLRAESDVLASRLTYIDTVYVANLAVAGLARLKGEIFRGRP
ncbi:MAG: TolC family protein, partial [bacterium]